MIFLGLTILSLVTVPPTLSVRIHERMSVDEVADIFHTTHNLVPDHEVVQFYIPRLNKRDLESPEYLVANAFGENIQLWLKPSEGVLAGQSTPVFTASIDPEGDDIVYKKIHNAMKNAGKLLEDPRTRASLIVRTDSRGQYSINGFIGSKNLIVRSLPDSIAYDFMQNRSSHNSEIPENSIMTKSAYHVMFKREVKHTDEINKSIRLTDSRSRVYTPQRNTPPPLPAVVYPEIMVVVDYKLFALTGKSMDKVLIYVLAFWNGVDLLYRSFEEPKFRFNIARVIIAEEPEATPYISQNMYNEKMIDAYKAHDEAQAYFFSIFNIFPANSYDAVMIMTGFEMTSGSGEFDTLGIARRNGACLVDYHRSKLGSLALTSDDGTFHGVSTAAHEFAHLLGARHDGGEFCKPTDGYIMAPSNGITENSHDFSDCTVMEIEQFLSQHRGICFYNEPKVIDPLPRGVLPGLLSDRDHQCKMLSRGKHCYTAASWQLPCTAAYCRDPKDSTRCFQHTLHAPPDGAYCDEGKVCLHGKCLKL